MTFFSDEIVVDVTHNSIEYFTPPRAVDPFHTPKRVPSFLLDHNPFSCDCRMYPYVDMKTRGVLTVDIQADDAICAEPISLKDEYITDLLPDQLVCDVDCPENCRCLIRPSRKRVEIDCPQLPSQIPQLSLTTHLRLRQPSDLTNLPPHVTYIDLSALNLTAPPVTNHAMELDLSKNLLTHIPVELLKLNCTVHLAGNPIDCSCGNKLELEYLKLKHHLVKDYRNVSCSNKLFLSGIEVDTLCAARDSTIISCSIALVGVLVAVLTALLYRFKTEVFLSFIFIPYFSFFLYYIG